MEKLNVALACGGTGGHIFPGLATAEALQRDGHRVSLWLAGKDLEQEAVAGWNGPCHTVRAEGFPSGWSLRSVRTAFRLLQAVYTSRKLMRRERPDVLLAMGSYASVGPAGAAAMLHVPVVLHEANVLPGRAVSFLARWADAVACSFEETRFYMKNRELVLTGMPLRRELLSHAHWDYPPALHRDRFTLLVMGGSRGARALNDMVSSAVTAIHHENPDIQVIHLTGHADEDAVRNGYAAQGVPHYVQAFSDRMAGIYAAADLAVCRSGAATCAELCAFGVPGLLVPYPHATHNHQLLNARALEKKNAADVILEQDLSLDWLMDYIRQCMQTPARLARMSEAVLKLSRKDAAELLADLVVRTGRHWIKKTGGAERAG